MADERQRNEQAYRRLKRSINATHPAGQYVALVDGKVVADAPTFRELTDKLDSIERDPNRRFVVQAGVDYRKTQVIR